jgi:hypothetical protein
VRIAIVGSWKEEEAEEWNLRNPDDFAEACREIGAEIARRKHVLLVGSESERTADRYAVEGAVSALGRATVPEAPIIVLRPSDGAFPYEELRARYSHLFTSSYSPESRWGTTRLFQIRQADALVIIGGARSSYQAGITAAVCGRRVVPIGSFGGAGKRLINLFQMSRGQWGDSVPDDDELGRLHNPWNADLLRGALEVLGGAAGPRLLIIHGRSDDRFRLKNYLQNRLDLPEPIIMGEQSTSGDTLPEKFERLARRVEGAIALVTPDDVGGLADSATSVSSLQERARENVWLEVGWFWGRLGRARFRLLVRGQPSIPSDLSGLEYSRYESDPNERGDDLRAFVDRLNAPSR